MRKKILSWFVVVLLVSTMFPTQVFGGSVLVAPEVVSATTNEAGDTITITFDKDMADPSADVDSFIVNINGYSSWSPTTQAVAVTSAAISTDPAQIDLTLGTPLKRGDIITFDYVPGNVAALDSTTLAAISAEPVTNAVPVVIESNLVGDWQAYDHVGNWGESPFTTGDDPRGNAYNRHIVIDGAEITFYGYGSPAYKDFLYFPSDETAAKGFDFDLDISGVIYHSMEGGGFMFNTQIIDGLLSGYCVLIRDGGYYDDQDVYIPGNIAKLYQIDGIDVDDFHDGLAGDMDNPAYITELDSATLTDGNLHSIRLETSATTVDLWDGTTKLIDNFSLPEAYGNGIGMIASYRSHGCSQLSIFKFSNLNINGIANLDAVLAGTRANLTFSPLEGATGVSVEQSLDGITFTPATLLTPITVSSTTATVTGLASKTTYYFRLVITGGKFDGLSKVATAEFAPGPIVDLEASGGNSSANLTFSAPEGATGIVVKQSTDGAIYIDSEITETLTESSTSATVTGLINGQEYSFKLIVTGGAYAGQSNIATATPRVRHNGGSVEPVVETPPDMLLFSVGNTDSFLKLGTGNEIRKPMDVAPIISGNRTLLPIRFVIEPLGGKIVWSQSEKKVTITRGDTTIELWIGNNTAKVNGVSKIIDPDNLNVKPLLIYPGRTMLPLRFISETLGCNVEWNQETQQITITNW